MSISLWNCLLKSTSKDLFLHNIWGLVFGIGFVRTGLNYEFFCDKLHGCCALAEAGFAILVSGVLAECPLSTLQVDALDQGYHWELVTLTRWEGKRNLKRNHNPHSAKRCQWPCHGKLPEDCIEGAKGGKVGKIFDWWRRVGAGIPVTRVWNGMVGVQM